MRYSEAMTYLAHSYAVGCKHGLAVFLDVLALLGHPQRGFKVIHVAGTNGKGSVCALLCAALTAGGYRTGLFTSPHLTRINERVSIDGTDISDGDLAAQIGRVQSAAARCFAGSDDRGLSFFEIMTAAAFCYFQASGVDCAVLETGLGGRLDPTNVVENPVLSVITAIGTDHTAFLGTTIAEITVEKAGIIKKDCPLVLCYQRDQVYNIIKQICQKKQAPLYYDSDARVTILKESLSGSAVDVRSPYYAYSSLLIRLSGRYQIPNLCTVLLSLSVLKDSGFVVDEPALRKALATAVWPGRMETVGTDPLILLDGAHNEEAAIVLKHSLAVYLKGRPQTFLIALMADKDVEAVLYTLAEAADRIILTKPPNQKRAAQPETLYTLLKNDARFANKALFVEADYKKALDLAVRVTPKDGAVCCAGSLYLVGAVRAYIKSVDHEWK